MTLTDHNTIDHLSDPSWTGYAGPVIRIPGQELSLDGHAQAINYASSIDQGTDSVVDVQRIIGEVHAAGGLFGINHPAEDGAPWAYGTDVTGFDSIETWNINWTYPPSNNPGALLFWQSWLDSGFRVPGLGGSDSHWILTSAAQGVGQPTTWVFASSATPAGIVDGVKAGRTFVSSQPPALNGARLFLSADAKASTAKAISGGQVRPGRNRFRVLVENGTGNMLRLVTNGGTVLQTWQVTMPIQEFVHEVYLPNGSWVRADLFLQNPALEMTAIASPIYVGIQ